MKTIMFAFAFLFPIFAFSQKSLVVHDLSQKQLRIMKQYKNTDSTKRAKVFIDSLYTPYKEFWNGYLGNAEDMAGWLAESMDKLPDWEAKNKTIDGGKLLNHLYSTAAAMKKMTGYAAKGKWYIVYGPAWTDLGGLGDIGMVIDLSHQSNSTNERILKMFPHELTHQIMTNVNKHKDTTAINSIIGEGFAVWMNQHYWKQKYTLAENLGYTEEELNNCEKNIDALKKFLATNKYSTDKGMINVFRSRSDKLNDKLPGAIGYYLGYKIIDAYVKKNGKNTWKDVFLKSPREITEKSGFTE